MNGSGLAVEITHAAEVEKACAADLSHVEDQGIVSVYTSNDSHELLEDGEGNRVVVLVPGNVPSADGSWEKSFQLYLRETREVVKAGYRIIYVHSGFNYPIWFTWWVFQLRSRVSRDHRKNLKALTIVHPTIGVRMFFLGMRPFVSVNFWEKLHYADRVEELFLDELLPASDITRILPVSVIANERKLIEDGEVARHLALAAGAQLTPRI